MIESQTRRLALSCNISEGNKSLYIEPKALLVENNNPIAFVSQVGDTMYLHQSLEEPNRIHFIIAMVKEVMMYERRKHWKF